MSTLFAKGLNGQLAFDGTNIVITREGFLARSTHGRSEKVISVRTLGGMQFKLGTALVNGWIQFSPAGETSKQHKGTGKGLAASSDENAVLFRKSANPDFQAVITAIREAQARD